MSTNSSISIKVGNKIKTIYSHWDGYPSNNGKILLESYKTAGKVRKLIALGDISSLAKNVKPKTVGLIHTKDENGFRAFDVDHKPIYVETTEPHTHENPHADVVVAYTRDRGETDVEAREYTDKIGEGYEYDYMFENNKWYMRTDENSTWVVLTKKMCEEN